MSQRVATLIGFSAILLWSTLAVLTTTSQNFPIFQLLSFGFFIGFFVMLLKWIVKRQNPLSFAKQPISVWLLGIYGLFGYHALYFFALTTAPALEANLINYLWPLFIVLFAGLLPNQRITSKHIIGVLLGVAGCGSLLLRDGLPTLSYEYVLGYTAALGCALVWSSYSVLNRRFAHIPTDTVGWFCLVTALLGGAAHLMFETTYIPNSIDEIIPILIIGIGPLGLAFAAWDWGVKKGDISLLGVLAYCTPLFSTLLLIVFGQSQLTMNVLIACALIVTGAIISSYQPKQH